MRCLSCEIGSIMACAKGRRYSATKTSGDPSIPHAVPDHALTFDMHLMCISLRYDHWSLASGKTTRLSTARLHALGRSAK